MSVSLAAQGPLTPQEERGRQIYQRGTSPSGHLLTASIGTGDSVPGAILPCANCHGHDGQGKPEGGIVPSNITWDALTKPYGLTHADGRSHPPYTERLIRRAIAMGIDPAGNPLNTAMPRFQLSMADSVDLVAYIKRLGQTVDTGLSTAIVRLGVILPPAAGATKTGQIMRQAAEDYFAHVNEAEGIFGRRIELRFVELPVNLAARGDAVRDFLGREKVFAVVCGALSGAEAEIAAVARGTGTPMLAGFAAFPQTAAPLNPYVFYLDGGIQDELGMLADFAARQFPGADGRAAVESSDEEGSRKAAQWLEQRMGQPADSQARLVFWLRSAPPATGLDRDAVFLLPGSLAGPAALTVTESAGIQVYVAQGMIAQDATRAVWDRSVACAEIMGEALKRAGRNLTRSTLIEALESFYRVETSLHVPITFGPTRRVGARNVRLMRLDSEGKLVPVMP